MYKIERKESGYLLTLEGFISKEEMDRWYSESQTALAKESSPQFCVIVDMRNLQPLPADAQARMIEGQKMYQQKGMNRSSVIVNSALTVNQFKRLAQESGIYQWERYFDGSKTNALEAAVAWGRDALDPDKVPAMSA